MGVRFTFPIYNENPRKRKALETEKEIIRSSRNTDVKEIKQSVNILLKRIENLNQVINDPKLTEQIDESIAKLKKYLPTLICLLWQILPLVKKADSTSGMRS